MNGVFIISLDFELLWGVRDHADRDSYGKNILGARDAIPRILELFEKYEIRATWATVGFLFCENKDELLEILPRDRPKYNKKYLSNYEYISEVGPNESKDPYYFAPSLISQILKTPKQEIGTHTLTHYYCLEEGQNLGSFRSDLNAAITLAQRRNIKIKSIVFPRNQFNEEHLTAAQKLGIDRYRGNPADWAYRKTKTEDQTPLRRGVRLIDSYFGIFGDQTYSPPKDRPTNVRASRFLRPYAGRLAPFHSAHTGAIRRQMTSAALKRNVYHLWWHPHNFGINIEENLSALEKILVHFDVLRSEFGFSSASMGDIG
ncbi:polysaccharide deacetylase family protein [Amorphus sp. 3PC139-8]|uniref:polysaccharide deacetylase family protein n=1 Tax=Amorphus sp. 3PC139-8 TaxID=2735676 RepID=UPI00345D233C